MSFPAERESRFFLPDILVANGESRSRGNDTEDLAKQRPNTNTL
jgi:hypothetical protein